MSIKPIDMEAYDRKEHFNHFIEHECSINITVEINVTSVISFVKHNKLRTMPVILWIISKAANEVKEFRHTLDELGRLCCFDVIHPGYVVINDSTKNFSCICTEYDKDFWKFYYKCVEDMNLGNSNQLFPQKKEPINIFSVTCMPRLPFKSFNIGLNNPSKKPIFATGKIRNENSILLLPLSIQVHHAFCDGYHIEIFLQSLENIINSDLFCCS